ncbi:MULTISPECIES: DUF1294 domain-containing protein [unclassified Aliiroseovarius]|uniref:DUF1294 domain-containing protein n=1 Tax=unclassified Aliiroseovarius TaxID=2623558 RepID=UPI0015699610|nr:MULTISPECIES: DUF1294 domain-containing protein [unclassified Aliiroseovarius]
MFFQINLFLETQLNTSSLIFGWFCFTSSVSYFLMFLDKRRAERGDWRISETTLQMWFLFGGALGGKIAQKRLRHKTRKQPFARMLNVRLGINLLIFAILITEYGRLFVMLNALRFLSWILHP